MEILHVDQIKAEGMINIRAEFYDKSHVEIIIQEKSIPFSILESLINTLRYNQRYNIQSVSAEYKFQTIELTLDTFKLRLVVRKFDKTILVEISMLPSTFYSFIASCRNKINRK